MDEALEDQTLVNLGSDDLASPFHFYKNNIPTSVSKDSRLNSPNNVDKKKHRIGDTKPKVKRKCSINSINPNKPKTIPIKKSFQILKEPLICPLCSQNFTKISILEQHAADCIGITSAPNLKLVPIPCPICNKNLRDLNNQQQETHINKCLDGESIITQEVQPKPVLNNFNLSQSDEEDDFKPKKYIFTSKLVPEPEPTPQEKQADRQIINLIKQASRPERVRRRKPDLNVSTIFPPLEAQREFLNLGNARIIQATRSLVYPRKLPGSIKVINPEFTVSQSNQSSLWQEASFAPLME